MLETIDSNVNVISTFRGRFRCGCPIKDEVDEYEITIKYSSNGVNLERTSVGDYLESFEGKEMFAEDLIKEIYDDLRVVLTGFLYVKLVQDKEPELTVEKGCVEKFAGYNF